MQETYLFIKRKQSEKAKIFMDIQLPNILGLTAIPLTIQKDKNAEYSDIFDNLFDLCKNLDSNYVSYDYESVKKYLSEAEI